MWGVVMEIPRKEREEYKIINRVPRRRGMEHKMESQRIFSENPPKP